MIQILCIVIGIIVSLFIRQIISYKRKINELQELNKIQKELNDSQRKLLNTQREHINKLKELNSITNFTFSNN
jgi:uncharacterized membrane protein (DUF106 family)